MIRVSLVAWYHVSLGKRKKEVYKLEKVNEEEILPLIYLEKRGGLVYN